jgi:hypothetical protein
MVDHGQGTGAVEGENAMRDNRDNGSIVANILRDLSMFSSEYMNKSSWRTKETRGAATGEATTEDVQNPHKETILQKSHGATLLATPPQTPSNGDAASNTSSPEPPSLCPEPYYPESRRYAHRSAAIDAMNFEQREFLQRDPRTLSQLNWFRRVNGCVPATYYSQLAPVGIHILENGQPAQTNEDDLLADFLIGDCKDLESWLLNGKGDKMFVLRDEDWFNTRPSISATEIFQQLQASSVNKQLVVEVQELEKVLTPKSRAVQTMPMEEVVQRWAVKDQSKAPINLLSLMCRDEGYQPWPLTKHCNLLNQAAASTASRAYSALQASAGKQATEAITRFVDLESCQRFMIFGQAGAISSWHMDAIGPYTYITLEPSSPGCLKNDVLKLWAYIRTDNLLESERNAILADFAKNPNFTPDPKNIKVISLVVGDTLIMPPGTIHAPITVTDCLFRGGMVMQKRQMRNHIESWRWICENGHCTNEEQPRQSRSILDFFKHEVCASSTACGYATPEEFESDYKWISGVVMRCKCANGCKSKKCGCILHTQRCGMKCHDGADRSVICENPYGCEVEEMKLKRKLDLEDIVKDETEEGNEREDETKQKKMKG